MQSLRRSSLVVITALITGGMVWGQNALNSPYSRFGLGDIDQQGFVRNQGMGGISLGMRNSKTIDYINPASFSARDSMSFLFDFSLQGKSNRLKTGDLHSGSSDLNFRHLAMAFPITHWLGASTGVTPFSTMAFNTLEEELLPEIGDVMYNYKGSGGMSRFYLGTAARFGNSFSLGVNMNYLFGKMERTTRVDFPDDPYAAETSLKYRMQAGGIYMSYGAQYHGSFKNDLFLNVGAIFENGAKVPTTITQLNESILYISSQHYSWDTLVNETTTKNLLLPGTMGAGFSFGKTNHFVAGADISFQNWAEAGLPGISDSLTNSTSLRGGMEYIPNPNALSNYPATIRYRLGAYYNQSYLRLKGQTINDFGISFGLGLPLQRSHTTINLAFQVGQRGSFGSELIRERYGMISLSISLYDFWFIKYKFD